MKDVLACSLFGANPARLPNRWLKSSATCSPLYLSLYDVQSPSIMAPSSPTTTAFINYRCAPSSVIRMHHGKKAALKMPSDECVDRKSVVYGKGVHRATRK